MEAGGNNGKAYSLSYTGVWALKTTTAEIVHKTRLSRTLCREEDKTPQVLDPAEVKSDQLPFHEQLWHVNSFGVSLLT